MIFSLGRLHPVHRGTAMIARPSKGVRVQINVARSSAAYEVSAGSASAKPKGSEA